MDGETKACGVVAEWETLPYLNVAMEQCGVALARGVRVRNDGDEAVEDAEVEVGVSPEGFAKGRVLQVGRLEPGEEKAVGGDDWVEGDFGGLSKLEEGVKGKIWLSVRARGAETWREERDLHIYAPDQWTGDQFLPELACAFVTPNARGVGELMKAVSAELESATGDGSIAGYKGGRARALEILKACYLAARGAGLRYALPPAGDWGAGQRVRLPETVLKDHLGTCLETTFLMASLAEQCGLHPLVVLLREHAFLGCHLDDTHFADPAVDDLATFRGRVASDAVAVVETTYLTHPGATFGSAEERARTDTEGLPEEEFRCAVDVKRARQSGVRPLALRRGEDGGWEWDGTAPEDVAPEGESAREVREAVDLEELETRGRDRMTRWQQKLLDLSLRNRLLNVRPGRGAVPLACADAGALEDRVAAGTALSVGALERLLGEKDKRDLEGSGGMDPERKGLLADELEHRRLWASMPEKDLGRAMTALYRETRTALEESGVNTLFLAVGTLQWKDQGRGAAVHEAPLLLIPVRLERGKAGAGMTLVRLDDDTLVNETLLEMLRTEFHTVVPGLEPLPTDDSGVDVPRVFDIFRAAVAGRAGWEVKERALLGRFSFGKFVMWTDMTARRAELEANALVRHLAGGGGVYDDGVEVFPEEEVAAHAKPGAAYCPLSADSSQLAAVLYSGAGKSFVLHGPPGTGKSQTIANIVAHNLALGRRVLFVSEKKAALDVVHKRLTALGLGPFCLELHSNKAGKGDVMRQYEEALGAAGAKEPEEWAREAKRLKGARKELDAYARELHREAGNGLSPYQCLAWAMEHEDDASFEWSLPGGALESREALDTLRAAAAGLSETLARTDPRAHRALEWIGSGGERVPEWSPVWERRAVAAARRAQEALMRLARAAKRVSGSLGVDSAERPETWATLDGLSHLCQMSSRARDLPPALLDDALDGAKAGLEAHFGALETLEARGGALGRAWDLRAAAEGDATGVARKVRRALEAKWWERPFRRLAALSAAKPLRAAGAGALRWEELRAAGAALEAYGAAASAVKSGDAAARRWLGEALPPLAETWGAARRAVGPGRDAVKTAETVLEAAREAYPEAKARRRALESLKGGELTDGDAREMPAALDALREALREASREIPAFANEEDLRTLAAHLEELMDCRELLRDATECARAQQEARRAGLEAFSERIARGELAPERGAEFFETVARRCTLDALLEDSPALRRFRGDLQDEKIRRFAELDARWLELTRKMVVAKLSAHLPGRGRETGAEGRELGVIQRECAKKSRRMPVRQLLERTPRLTALLKPCFLMSPLSVAQYLPAEGAAFDLVVFDEASQIPTWDAIGVLARAPQHIVVGDPKQMPPTNFFQKGEGGDADEGDGEEGGDLESILDECIAAGMASAHLDWHYRSRYEGLIAFSNHHYYGGRLKTFPAAKGGGGVEFRFVEGGVYDRRKSRTNRREAEEVAKFAAELAREGRGSVGVVAFSEAQRDLIEDLLEEMRGSDRALDAALGAEGEEPLFVKNLENVQGDERDTVLFSVGYAPDEGGTFSMNFGPLNRQGGERRLNVAITRAKERVVVFASVRGRQIDLSRTTARGAAHLRAFLEYAERGEAAWGGGREGAGGERAGAEEDLGDTVARFLESRGWTVDRNVGGEGGRVDVAVRRRGREGEYAAGVLCDGPGYAAQRETRDREALRAAVLRGMGWRLARAWSVDWAFDRQRAEARLAAEIEAAEREADEQEAAERAEAERVAAERAAAEAEEEQSREEEKSDIPGRPYTSWRPAELREGGLADLARNPEAVKTVVREILAVEAPMAEETLCRRVAKAWGSARVTKNAAEAVRRAASSVAQSSGGRERRTWWCTGQNPGEWREWRRAGECPDIRGPEELAPEEIAAAMRDIREASGGGEGEDLFRETLRVLGFPARMPLAWRNALSEAAALLP